MRVLFIDPGLARVFTRVFSFRQYLLTHYRTIRQRMLAISIGTGEHPRQRSLSRLTVYELRFCTRQQAGWPVPCCLVQN
ncbi:hypothetical protein [Spirosoma linguale]|uniref:hypothetical protein n=1 Tax=Spirosoma linguale TaxID=108 RepID=UPI003CC7E500